MTCPVRDECWRKLTRKEVDRPTACQFELIGTRCPKLGAVPEMPEPPAGQLALMEMTP